MAFLECNFHSDILGRACMMNVIVPQKAKTQIGMASSGSCERKNYPVLYLLHGLSDNHTIWMRRTSIERYASLYDLVVVMPDGGRGFYTDMKAGDRWWTMISEELPQIVANLFPVSTRREDTFAAGLSMGGYGALKLALRRPDLFAGAAGLSSVADVAAWFRNANREPSPFRDEMRRIFGNSEEELIADDNDLLHLVRKTRQAKLLPRLFMACGTEDGLYAGNQNLRRELEKSAWPDFHYEEGPGSHSWEFWDSRIQNALHYLLA